MLLFTVDFPDGHSEFSFLKEEIGILAKNYQSIKIFPLHPKENRLLELPQNVEVHTINFERKVSLEWHEQIRVIGLSVGELMTGRLWSFKKLIRTYSQIKSILRKAKLLKEYFISERISSNCVYYSYWCDEWVNILMLARFNSGSIKISRCHGFDLYEERHDNSYILFRKKQIEYLDRLVAISEHGKNYLDNKYPKLSGKFFSSKLGIPNPKNIKYYSGKKEFLIVSCSSFAKVKRVDLIFDLLSSIDLPIQWNHLGGNPDEISILKDRIKLSKSKLKVNLHGYLKNDNVVSFYKNNFVDAFINLSYSEGIPVSMMEAIGNGIPVIATCVGGVPEIVNKKTGLLISRDFEIEESSKQIKNWLCSFVREDANRDGVRQFWLENFSAERNFNTFVNLLKD